jgi:hypothetical protein
VGVFLLKFFQRNLFALKQGFVESVVLFFVERAVDVVAVVLFAGVVAGLAEGDSHVDALVGHNGGEGVVKVEVFLAAEAGDGLGQRAGGERPAGDNGGAVGNIGHFFSDKLDAGMVGNGRCHQFGKPISVNS